MDWQHGRLYILSVIKCIIRKCTVRMSIVRKYTIMKYTASRCTVRICEGRKCMIVGRVVVCRMYHTTQLDCTLSLITTCDALEYDHTQRPQIPFNASGLAVHSTWTHIFRSTYSTLNELNELNMIIMFITTNSQINHNLTENAT